MATQKTIVKIEDTENNKYFEVRPDRYLNVEVVSRNKAGKETTNLVCSYETAKLLRDAFTRVLQANNWE